MAEHRKAWFKSLLMTKDGELVIARLNDGNLYPGVKGTRDGQPFLMVLADKVQLGNGTAVTGPYLLFGDEDFVVLGKDFIVDYDPSPKNIGIHDAGNLELGSLVVLDDRTCVVAHSPAGMGLVDIDSGEEPRLRRPMALIKKWALGLRRADDTITWLYERT